jgi:glycosyltransferase involved in cell wall biosynthesis
MLCGGNSKHRYVLFADRCGNIPALSTIPVERSRGVDPAGSLDWRFIRNRWITRTILWQGAAPRIALSRSFDVIIFIGDAQFLSTWIAAALARLRGKRVLMWTHGMLRSEAGLKGLVRRAFYRLAHGLLLYGQRARALLVACNFKSNNLYVVYNSLDTAAQLRSQGNLDAEAVSRARQSLHVPENAPLLISIGRMTREKELHVLVTAMARLRSPGDRAHLLLVGDGPARVDMERLVGECGLSERVHFLGEIYSEQQLCPLICAADLCVSPGSVGLAAMHAMIYGTPVITHDQLDAQKPEFEAIRSGLTGGFFHRGDADHLARTIEEWLSTGPNPRRRTMCTEAILRHYTPRHQCDVIDAAVDAVPASLLTEYRPMAFRGTVEGAISA